MSSSALNNPFPDKLLNSKTEKQFYIYFMHNIFPYSIFLNDFSPHDRIVALNFRNLLKQKKKEK